MESFTPHPDLVLLQSLSRELTDNLVEAVQAGNGPEALMKEMDVDGESIAGFADFTVDKIDRMLRHMHKDSHDGLCDCARGFVCGMFLEAFAMGFRYQAEKAEWAKTRAFLDKPQDPPAPAQADPE